MTRAVLIERERRYELAWAGSWVGVDVCFFAEIHHQRIRYKLHTRLYLLASTTSYLLCALAHNEYSNALCTQPVLSLVKHQASD